MADKEKRDWRMYYNKETANKAKAKYAKTHEKQIRLVLHVENDSDIIDHLNKVQNKNGYLKRLIRNDIGVKNTESEKKLRTIDIINNGLWDQVPTAPGVTDDEAVSNTPDED